MCLYAIYRGEGEKEEPLKRHYSDAIMGTIASQFTSVSIVYLTVSTGADQRKHQSSASLAFVKGIHRGPVNSPHKWPVTRKMFPFDDVISAMSSSNQAISLMGTNSVSYDTGTSWLHIYPRIQYTLSVIMGDECNLESQIYSFFSDGQK